MYRMRLFYILVSIILLTSTPAKSQVRTSLPDPEPKVVKFYPNPAISFITFEIIEKEENKTYQLQIFNFLGRMVKEVNEVNVKTTVNVGDLVRGLYIFQLREPNGRIAESGRFQVNK
jgi:Secretion system C-terminal sorting domain